MDQIRNIVYKLVSESINNSVTPDQMNETMKIAELGINSMTLISIMFGMESELDVEIADMADDIEPPETLGDLVKYAAKMKEIIKT